MKRTGPLRSRLAVRALRSGVVVWSLFERLGVDVAGATEGPPIAVDETRRRIFDDLIAAARAGNGTLDATTCPYPLHELLTHLVAEHALLLHGSNHTTLELLEPRPARDFDTELLAVVACDDGIWPIFYAVVDRDRCDGVFTACLHRRAVAASTPLRPAVTPPIPPRGRTEPSMRCRGPGSDASGVGSGCARSRSARSCACLSAQTTSRSATRSSARRRSSSGGSSSACARRSASAQRQCLR